MIILYLFLLFQIKHFVVDFPLQVPYMWQNKGTWGHLGGLLHAGLHGLTTGLIFFSVGAVWYIALFLALLDFAIHYVVDWGKMNLNRHWQLGPTTSPHFWTLLGADQLIHQLTYILLIWLWMPTGM